MMVRMFHYDDDDHHDEEHGVGANDHSFELQRRFEAVDDELRKLGIYVNSAILMVMVNPNAPLGANPMVTILQVEASIGKVAFAPRVQHPESESIELEFRNLEQSYQNDEFLDQRNRIAQALAEGRDPFSED